MTPSLFENSCGKIVTITYADGPSQVTKKGRLVDIENEFLILETYSNRFYIRENSIIALKECLEGSE